MSPVGIFRLDKDGRVTYGNPRWEYSDNETLVELVHPKDRSSLEDLWRYALENEDRISFELRWGTMDSFLWTMGERTGSD
jgi:PAS domain-containing protein